jgi:hypothetical protein
MNGTSQHLRTNSGREEKSAVGGKRIIDSQT